MNIAFRAMQFAREVHKDQRRKYTGNLRTSPRELIDAMSALYIVGMQVSWISEKTGIGCTAIRNYVANHDLERDESLFSEGVHCMAEEDESFRVIPWAPWYYVSDRGRVVGMSPSRPGTLLVPYEHESGYWSVKLIEADGAHRHNYLHRAVLRVFVGEPAPDQEGAHGDGKRHNNRLNNLRWATRLENIADKIGHGTLLKGSAHPSSKINEEIAATIKRRLRDGDRQADISRTMNVHISCVANIAQDKTWRHVEIARAQAEVQP